MVSCLALPAKELEATYPRASSLSTFGVHLSLRDTDLYRPCDALFSVHSEQRAKSLKFDTYKAMQSMIDT